MTVFTKERQKTISLLGSQHSLEYNLRGQAQNPLDYRKPNFKSRAASNSFSAKGPAFWNSTPNDLRKIEQRGLFKRTLKKTLLVKYEI